MKLGINRVVSGLLNVGMKRSVQRKCLDSFRQSWEMDVWVVEDGMSSSKGSGGSGADPGELGPCSGVGDIDLAGSLQGDFKDGARGHEGSGVSQF